MVLTLRNGPRPDEVTGPSTTYGSRSRQRRLDLPARVWEPRLNGATGSFGARVAWTAVPGRVLPPGLGSADRSYSIAFARGDEPVWTVGAARSGFAFDARVLEDSTGTGAVVAAIDGEKVSDELGRKIDIALRSGARAYEGPAGAPPSRGRSASSPMRTESSWRNRRAASPTASSPRTSRRPCAAARRDALSPRSFPRSSTSARAIGEPRRGAGLCEPLHHRDVA